MRKTLPQKFLSVLIFFGGIILPIAALVVELTLGFCSMMFFDPIPDAAHICLVAFVPLINAVIWYRLRRDRVKNVLLLATANGVALAVSCVYATLFLPILPLAAIYTAFSVTALFLPALITLLPYAPFLSVTAAAIYGRRLSRHPAAFEFAPRTVFRTRLGGFILGILFCVGAELPRAVTHLAVVRLAKDGSDAAAIQLVRRWGESDDILRAAYGDEQAPRDFLSWLANLHHPRDGWFGFDLFDGNRRNVLEPDAARMLYYRITGKSFNSVPRPRAVKGWFSWRTRADVGGSEVGGKSDDVSLISSTLDGSVSADTLTSYTEWTLEFKNDSDWQQEEARGEIALPAGGVVSRATLWINDEEVEALLGSRAEARAVYQSVVNRRRDPLLVTTAGPDRVLFQCFPILPKGGRMKIRLGITAPVVPIRGGEARLHFPRIVERNFVLPPSLSHAVWVESHATVHSIGPATLQESKQENVSNLRGRISAISNELEESYLTVDWDQNASDVLSLDDGQLIRQSVHRHEIPSFEKAVFVIDTSAAAKPYLADIIAAIHDGAAHTTAAIFLAGDEVQAVTPGLVTLEGEALDHALSKIRRAQFVGGVDNVPALRRALELAETVKAAPVIWIHTGQPIHSPDMNLLEQVSRRSVDMQTIFSVRLGLYPDRLEEQLEQSGLLLMQVPPALRDGTLTATISSMCFGAEFPQIERNVVDQAGDVTGVAQIGHLNRLFAATQVEALLKKAVSDKKNPVAFRAQALALATKYRLVTPVSGAVVLDKSDAAAAAGLEPAEPAKVPAVPEPEMVCLFSALLLLASMRCIYAKAKR